jgi:hypothetical protein
MCPSPVVNGSWNEISVGEGRRKSWVIELELLLALFCYR